jgi:hypothetical protein
MAAACVKQQHPLPRPEKGATHTCDELFERPALCRRFPAIAGASVSRWRLSGGSAARGIDGAGGRQVQLIAGQSRVGASGAIGCHLRQSPYFRHSRPPLCPRGLMPLGCCAAYAAARFVLVSANRMSARQRPTLDSIISQRQREQQSALDNKQPFSSADERRAEPCF